MATFYLLDRQGFSFQKPVTEISNTPPVAPSAGDACLVGTSGSGDFAGHSNKVAVYDGSSWTFSETPDEGWFVYDQDTSKFYYFSTSWVAWDETANLTKTLGATAQFLIDAATTDHTGSIVAKIDVDVNSASVTGLDIDMDVTTALSAEETMTGLSLHVDGHADDPGGAMIYGIYIVSNGTGSAVKRAINIDANFDHGIISASLAKFSAGLELYGSELFLDQDGDTSITSDTDDQIDFKCSGTDQLILVDGKLYPTSDDDIDLGDSTHEFKDLWLDGTAYIDHIELHEDFNAKKDVDHTIKIMDGSTVGNDLYVIGGGGDPTGSDNGGDLILDGGAHGSAGGTDGDVKIANNQGAMVVGSGGSRITKMEYDSDLNELIVTTA